LIGEATRQINVCTIGAIPSGHFLGAAAKARRDGSLVARRRVHHAANVFGVVDDALRLVNGRPEDRGDGVHGACALLALHLVDRLVGQLAGERARPRAAE
jgi:hypothetical protein